MSAMSVHFENALIDFLFRGQPLAQPLSVYLALGSLENPLPPLDEAGVFYFGHGVDEVASPSYARVAVPCDLTHWSGTDGATSTGPSNGTSATTHLIVPAAWPVCREVWSPSAISHLGIFDAPTGGNLLWFTQLATSFVTAPGTQVRIKAGALAVSLNTAPPNPNAPAGSLLLDGSSLVLDTNYLVFTP